MTVLRLSKREFGRGNIVCTGHDLAEVVGHVGAVSSDVQWYIAGVEGLGDSWPTGPHPVLLGSTADTVARLVGAHQFEWAVLAATTEPVLRLALPSDEMWADDQPDRPMGNALVFVRAFAFAYVEIGTDSEALIERFTRVYGDQIRVLDPDG